MAINYLYDHPWSPIGFTVGPSASIDDVATSSHFFVGDSGPLEYLLRGSFPLLFFIYFGLYKFLMQNVMLRSYAWGLFLAIVVFEAGFSVLSYPRTYYLLPFFVIYLNWVSSSHLKDATDGPHVAQFKVNSLVGIRSGKIDLGTA